MTQFVTVDRTTLEQMVNALENSIDDVRTYLADVEPLAGYARYDRRIAAYKEQVDAHEAAITEGRAALANAERVEPIAFGRMIDGVIADVICPETHEVCGGGYTVPLYTQPLAANSSAKTLQELAVKGCGKCFYQDCDFPNCCKPKMLSDILKDTL